MGEAITAVVGEPVPRGGQVEVVLGLLEQLLPDADRHDDGLRVAAGAEIDRLGGPGVETLRDAMQGRASLTGAD